MNANQHTTTRYISILNAKEHNLNSVSVNIPRDSFVVITGLSGSGKSSLAFDTIYAEGQRRYIESLSVYARQFLDQLKKPDVESIIGLTPTIAIEQRTARSTPRSTIATMTEIYDYYRLLYTRIGVLHCPTCHRELKPMSIDNIITQIMSLPAGSKLQIIAPIIRSRKGEFKEIILTLLKEGFSRIRLNGEIMMLEEVPNFDKNKKHNLDLIVDRLVIKEEAKSRITDSVEIALKKGGGLCYALIEKAGQIEEISFSEHFSCPDHGIVLEEISPRIFSFNNPYGACKSCFGLGTLLEPEEHLVIPDKKLSLADGAIYAWKKCGSGFNLFYPNAVKKLANLYKIKVETPWEKIPEGTRFDILHGSSVYEGILVNLKKRFSESFSDDNKTRIHQFMSDKECISCQGQRLRSESLAVTINKINIAQLTNFNVQESLNFINSLKVVGEQSIIASPIINNIKERLTFLIDVGLNYLKLNRTTRSLSGGEFQRIKLTSHIGAMLSGVTYVLDEPTIGLHQSDNDRLINTLKKLRDLGNTLIVVEHDEDVIANADFILDLGPEAGINGGHIVAQGTIEQIKKSNSLTAKYLNGELAIHIPNKRRQPIKGQQLVFKGCMANNLKNIDIQIPLNTFTCITGVSGAGKSSLVVECIYENLKNSLLQKNAPTKFVKSIAGIDKVERVIMIDQSPIGKTPRSNPVTYTGIFDDIRLLFAKMPKSIELGYKPARFSFNVKGGRCEACSGQGEKKVEMHFLPDVYVTCDICLASRYNKSTLQIEYKGKNISQVLDMSIDEALVFFTNQSYINKPLELLSNIGLGYVKLGQSAVSLSGGEAQRIKLCSELSRRTNLNSLYIMDEPTTGLHFHDIVKLLKIINMLVDKQGTVLVIEHNLDVIKSADWVIDIGPQGGDAGGQLLFAGQPEALILCKESLTASYLAHKL